MVYDQWLYKYARLALPVETKRNVTRSTERYHQRNPRRFLGTPYIDLIGPYTFGKDKNEAKLHCLTMIDPATGWFEIARIDNRRADYVVNVLEHTWLTRYPWPTEIVMDRGKEFAAEVSDVILC